jgi:hypothetical protein
MIQREAVGNDRRIEMKHGKLQHSWPAITIAAHHDKAEFTLAHGLGHVPITFTGLSSSRGFTLFIDDQPLNQSIHGNDFWQTDYDAASKTWSQTYNVPMMTKSRMGCVLPGSQNLLLTLPRFLLLNSNR